MVEIKPIEDYLGELSMLPLRCLAPDRQPYSAMLLQPDGPIEGTTNRVGHQDSARGGRLCRSFLRQCMDEHADLVVTPEYCVPWATVSEIAVGESALRPSEGALWILGCESISPNGLQEVTAKLLQAGHFVYHEVISAADAHMKSYVDPLLYVFWCLRRDMSRMLCFFIQFKTAPSRDGLDVEQRSLCLGTLVYTFNRGLNQIGLMSIICSDAFAFTETLVNDFHSNMLLIHIQLNPKPAHTDYARYRTQLLSVASNKDVELLCLNWAGDIVERTSDGKDKPWSNNACSAFYVPPGKFRAQEQIVNDAHRQGLYYSLVGRWHALYLHQQPHAILLQKQKVMMHGDPQSLMPTTCATVVRRWTWNTEGDGFAVSAEADDGFEVVVAFYPNLREQLKALSEQSPIAVERALEMLVGAPKNPDRWFEIGDLESMRVANGEALRRITVHQDFDPDSQGVPFRKQRLQRAQDAATLPGKGVPWPPPLRDLEQGFSYTWTPGQPYQNVRATQTGRGAGLVYLGDQSDDDEVRKVYSVMQDGTARHAFERATQSNPDPEDAMILVDAMMRSRDRLCVVYRRDHQLHVWGVERMSRIDRPPEQSAFDIAGESA